MSIGHIINTIRDRTQKNEFILYVLLFLCCHIFIFITLPISMASLEDNVDGMPGYISFYIFWISLELIIYSCSCMAIYYICNKNIRTILIVLLCYLLILSIVYAFIYKKDYGVLDNFIFSNPMALSPSWGTVVIDALIFAISLGIVYALLCHTPVFLANILSIFLISNVLYAGLSIYNMHHKISKIVQYPLPEGTKLYHYTKTGRNILLFFIDGAIGGFLPDILQEDKSLEARYDGFTWYSNVVSTGNRTINGLPAVFGGFDYTVSAINERKGPSLKEKVSRAYALYPDNFGGKDYEILYSDPFWYGFERKGDCEAFENCFQGRCIHSIGKYLPGQRDVFGDRSKFFQGLMQQYIGLAIFKIAPATLKFSIYGNGNWMGLSYSWKKKEDKYLDNYFSLAALSDLSDTKAVNNTFTFIANELPRAPLLIQGNGLPDHNLVATSSQLEKYKDMETTAIYQTTRCTIQTLARYMDWFKNNNIYDNSMFIIVSDHGWACNNPMLDGNKYQSLCSMFQCFLMIKPFNTIGKLKESKEFISNANVPGIICHTIGGCVDRHTGKTVDYEKLQGPVTLFETPWQPSGQKSDAFIVDHQYQVIGDITKGENWRILE